MTMHLKEQIKTLPARSGVYLFRDRRGTVLYVGKAQNLKKRVQEYLSGRDPRPMVTYLMASAKKVDFFVTNTEKEALLLESEFIKREQPRYNIRLRDDSSFLHLRLNIQHQWPRFTLVRKVKDDQALYFGPYTSAHHARQTLAFLQKQFPLRTCTDRVLKSRHRPCLLYQMNRCVAPCGVSVSKESYQSLVEGASAVLKGQSKKVLRTLRVQMKDASAKEDYEEAARIRDLMTSIETTVETQSVVDNSQGNRDIWGIYWSDTGGLAIVLSFRKGVSGEPQYLTLDASIGTRREQVSSLINNTYDRMLNIPSEIFVPELPEDHEALEEVLRDRRGKKVTLRRPQRGQNYRLVNLAGDNARLRWQQDAASTERADKALSSLGTWVGAVEPPRRVECFDNSHLSGKHPVAAMAVFIDGQPARGEYRRYRIKEAQGDDDYAMMREVLSRRIRRGLDDGVLPDLIVVDGGRGQVGVAQAILQDAGCHGVHLVGISKPRLEKRRGEVGAQDKMVLPQVKDPIRFKKNDPTLLLLQHIRDEAHQHAISYQRRVRQRSTLHSELENIPGVGPQRCRSLLKTLGSVKEVSQATLEEIAGVPGVGPDLAKRVYAAMHSVFNDPKETG